MEVYTCNKMKWGNKMENTRVYLPFRFRLTSIIRTALINFKKDPDSEYTSFELQVIERDSGGEGYQVLAWRKDGYKDVYIQENLTIDEDEELLTVGGKGIGETYRVQFKESYFEEDEENQLKIGFLFYDKNDRRVVFHLTEDLAKDSNQLSWLPSVGSKIIEPVAMPLFYLYDFDFVRKKESEVFLSIGGEEHAIDSYAFPKDFQPRINIQYSMDTVITNFNENRKAPLIYQELDENNQVKYNGKISQYENVDGNYHLKTITLEHPRHPVEIDFNPSFPSQAEIEEANPKFGEFTIEPSGKLGKLTGQYNVVRQQGKAIINLSFREGWQTESNAGYKSLINNLSTDDITEWYKSYQCVELIDLESQEVEVSWKRINSERRK